ncbi:TetR/AcrR family transcriptional regulator [Naasia lichenicola]|nr:TetR/AcrR family transcriptional regulator [Naasia lichenicola]
MPRVTDEHRAARREQIAEAALRAFAERGFQHTSMADIMDEAGLSAGGVYGHFASKREIAIEVAGRVMSARSAEIESARVSDPLPEPSELIGRVVRSMRGELRDSRLILQLWAESSIDQEMREIVAATFARHLRQSMTGYFTEWARQNRSLPDPEAVRWADLVTPAIIGMIQGFIVQSALLDDFDEQGYLAAIAELLPH